VAEPLTILLVGGGGREHALAWRLRQENPSARILAAPGNPGIAELATCVPVRATDVPGLVALARQERVEWTLVGPEAPLAAGLADAFRAESMPIFGPTRAAAAIESSKAFAKEIMSEAGVPTARATTCRSLDEANRAIDELADDAGGGRVVIKASGLAAGKGVVVAVSREGARAAAASMLTEHAFGDAGDTLLVEEFMDGEELSVFAITDGERVITLPASQDHKRLRDHDQGPNTGGMGAYCPVSLADAPGFEDDVVERIVRPTLAALRARGTPFTGLMYVGLMVSASGPRVVEFNCRFGDPETEAVLPAIGADVHLFDAMSTVARGERLSTESSIPADRAAVTTVIAAAGYPEHPRSGDEIRLPPVEGDLLVFHAGTARGPGGGLETSGGRVLAVTGVGATLEDARARSQEFARAVEFTGKQFRSDIAWRELSRRARVTRD
jgi:phosphoribosylamine--glycine ligase